MGKRVSSSSDDLDNARSLLAQAETERDPVRKLAALEEALDFLEAADQETEAGSRAKVLVANLRRSYMRRLVTQLLDLKGSDLPTWFAYAQFLLVRLRSDVRAVLAENPELERRYEEFIQLWDADLRRVLAGDP